MKSKELYFVLALTAMLTTFSLVIIKSVELEQNCTGYLKRAADASTIETAKKELSKAIAYLEENNLTTGYTSVLYKTPDEDIAYWYGNLKASLNELEKVDSTTSALEKTNILMKLRETLLDNREKGDNLTYPHGLSRYPNNGFLAVIIVFVFLSFGISLTLVTTD